MEEKEYLYLGIYRDTDGNKILKIGTTNDLDRRKYQHNYSYKKAKTHKDTFVFVSVFKSPGDS